MQSNHAKGFDNALTAKVKHESLGKLEQSLQKHKPKVKRKAWTTLIRPDLRIKFKATCATLNEDMYEVVETLISGWLKDKDTK
jgi:hypothetical protein